MSASFRGRAGIILASTLIVLAAAAVASAQTFPNKPVEFVAFKSGAEAALSVLGGHVPFTTENLSDYEPIPRPLRNSLAVSALP